MTDFLTHLAERALRVGPAVRPALRPRFASGSEAPPAPESDTGWDLTRGIAGPVGHAEAPPAEPPLDEAHPKDRYPAPGVFSPLFDDERPAPAVHRALAGERSGPVLASPEPHVLPTRAPPSAVNGEHALSPQPHTDRSGEATAEPRAPSHTPDPFPPAHPVRPVPDPTPPGREPRQRAVDRTSPLQHPELNRPAGTVRPVLPPRRASAEASEPGPIVRVIIGRIDVRAAPPVSPPPAHHSSPRPQPGPRLALDAYLSRRNGSRR